MVNVLVTGANGFIGKSLCASLVSAGHKVRGVVRSEKSLRQLADGVESVITGEIGPDTEWREALEGIEAVIHLAARVHIMEKAGAEDYEPFFITNTQGTLRLAKEAEDAGVKKFIFASSVKAVGESNESPWDESVETRPEDAYGKSKAEAETTLMGMQGEMEIVILRLPLVYGPGVKANMARLISLAAKGVPLPFGLVRNSRSMLYVKNFNDAVEAIIKSDQPGAGIYFLSDGEDVSTPELARTIAQAMGRRPMFLPVGASLLYAVGKVGDLISRLSGKRAPLNTEAVQKLTGSLSVDISKFRKTFGWRPPYSFEDGIRETVLSATQQKGTKG